MSEQALTAVVENSPVDLAILSWLDAKKRHSGSEKTHKAYADTLYTFANKRGFITCGNPISTIERSRVQSYRNAQPLDVEEVAERMQAIDRTTKQGARDYAILAILLQTGRRLSEVIDLRWRNVLLKGSRITLVFEHCKGGKVMRDTIPPGVSTALLEWLTMAYGARLRGLSGDAPLWISFTRKAAVDEDQADAFPPPLTSARLPIFAKSILVSLKSTLLAIPGPALWKILVRRLVIFKLGWAMNLWQLLDAILQL